MTDDALRSVLDSIQGIEIDVEALSQAERLQVVNDLHVLAKVLVDVAREIMDTVEVEYYGIGLLTPTEGETMH